MRHSIVVIEDHPAVREGLVLVLEREGFDVRGGAGTVDEGFGLICEQAPDVALVDLELPDATGTELTLRLQRRGSATSVVLYTGTEDLDLLEEGLASGAKGIALKSSPPDTVLRAVRAVANGGTFVDPEVVARLADRDAPVERLLTVREREVLGRLAEGRSIEEIAEELVLSVETVRTHVRNAMGKLGTRTRAHAIVVALRRGELAL